MKKIIKSTWFTNLDSLSIGVVIYLGASGEERASIGIASGIDEEMDEQLIATKGAKFPLESAKLL